MTQPNSLWRRAAALAVASLALSVGSTAAPATKGPPKGSDMDYGPFLSYSVLKPQLPPATQPAGAKKKPAPKKEPGDPTPPWKAGDLMATKGIVVKLPGDAAVCFDTDTCRYAGAWTGGWLDISKCNLTHVQGPLPTIAKGTLVYTTPDAPGWAKAGSFSDPRHPNTDKRVNSGEGPLPKEWAHYRGMYRDGEKVVFAYSVGGVEVLDMPGAISEGGRTILTRTIRIERCTQPITLRACGDAEATGALAEKANHAAALTKGADLIATGLVGDAPAGVVVKPEGGQAVDVTIPASSSLPVQFTLATITDRTPAVEKAFATLHALKLTPDNPASHTKGGPALWLQEIESTGSKAKDEKGAYVVDTAGLPTENPWKSWIKVGGFDFFADGRCAFCTLNGDVWVTTSPLTGGLGKTAWKRFAAGLYEPLGLRIVEGKIHVLGRDQITILHDLNGDNEADFYENFNNDAVCDANYHSFHYELQTDADGNFYYAVTGNQMPLAKPDSACVIKVSKYGDTCEVVSSGLRAANGMGSGPNGEITVSDNQGHWTPASPIYVVKPGAFFGYHGDPRKVSKAEFAQDEQKRPHDDPPLCWVPYKWDNSSGSEVWAAEKDFGPLSGRMLHTSYGKSAVFEVLAEQVDGVWQGGAVPLPLTFESGIMRGRVNPADHTVWFGGLKGWQTNAGKDACLQRVRYTGKPFVLPTEMHVTANGIQLKFPVELDAESAKDPGAYSMEVWCFHRTENYGSDDYKVSDPETKGRDALDVKAIELSPDKRTLLLKFDGLKPVPQYQLTGHINAADGTPIKLQVGGTINVIGHRK